MPEIPIDRLTTFGRHAYEHAGLSPDDAQLVVDIQLTADLRGVDTHGFQRLPWYVEHLQEGRYNAQPSLAALQETAVSLVLDGDRGVGQLICARLMERTIAKAQATGLALGTLRKFQRLGLWRLLPHAGTAQAGLRQLLPRRRASPRSPPSGAPPGSAATTPMAFALPRRDAPPVVLDMALTPVALGKVLRARAEGQEIPQSWGFLSLDGPADCRPGHCNWRASSPPSAVIRARGFH